MVRPQNLMEAADLLVCCEAAFFELSPVSLHWSSLSSAFSLTSVLFLSIQGRANRAVQVDEKRITSFTLDVFKLHAN